MTVDRQDPAYHPPQDDSQTTAQLLDQLTRFDGPPEQFLLNLLALQCRVSDANAGAVFRITPDGRVEALAVYPPPAQRATAPVWIAQAVELVPQVIDSGQTTIKPVHGSDDLYGEPAKRHLVMIPLRSGGFQGLAAFLVEGREPTAVAASRERLEVTAGFISLYEMRLALQRRGLDLERLRTALEILPAVNDHDRFMAAAMAFCNEAAARWNCEWASLGFLKGRYVQLRAMSHTEKFSRKMKLVQDIEASMEECLDQDTEVVQPAETDATYISRAAAELSRRHGPFAVVSLPLRRAGEVIAVLTLERAADQPFTLNEVEAIRLACELCTARLASLHEHDRWFGARLGQSIRKGAAGLLGPEHTWKKLIAMLVLAGAIFLTFAKGDYTAEAPFKLEATERRVVPAPFDGYLKDVFVKPGDNVRKADDLQEGDDLEKKMKPLATLETAELKLQLAAARADWGTYRKQADAAISDDKRAEAQIAQAQMKKMAAQIALLEYKIGQARIKPPISGTVVVGDLKRQIGAPVKTGDVLFEIARIDALHAELAVPEDRIAEVKVGQKGELAAKGYAEQRFQFEVERINPAAEVVNQRNVFKVRVRLIETAPWMRPGMEGLAKVHLGRRRYAWLWTHRVVNWLRMKLWL